MALVKFREITRAAYNNLKNKEANTQYYITETDGTFSIAFGDKELKGNQPLITGAASTITSSNLTANRALISNGNGKVAVSAVTSTQLGYLSGVTSSVQTQLNGKSRRVILTGQLQTTSYRRSVIALCELTNTNASANSYSVGTLTFHRTNGLSSAVKYDFAIEKRYNTAGFNLSQTVLADSGFVGGIRPCTFVKNGVKYGGIEIFFF